MQRTILIVDDNELDRQIFAAMVSKLGFMIVTCHGGQEAIALLNTLPGSAIDLMLLDLHMDNVDGISMLGHCKAHQPHLPVIIITASDDPDDKAQTEKWGAKAFITKPVTPEKLAAAIKAALPGGGEYQKPGKTGN
jgi:CheY-like chemotaxis protein